MANRCFNISLGEVKAYYRRVKENDPTNAAIIIVLLKVAEVDGTLEDYDELNALLLAAGNTEADFTNYARKVLTDADLAAVPAPDDANSWIDLDLPDQTYTAAGGAANNTMVKAIICYDSDTTGGTDANIIPLTHHDYTPTTDGSDLPLNIDANGFFRAQS